MIEVRLSPMIVLCAAVAVTSACSAPSRNAALNTGTSGGLFGGATPQVAVDNRLPPLPAPVDPATAAATLRIPDGVANDQLWQVGSTYFSMQRFPEAAAFFWKGANAGDSRAESALGAMYMKHEGVIEDYQQGAFWLTKAAEGGNRGAQFTLGAMYERGIGVPRDPVKAVTLYTASAQQNNPAAARALALDYEFGRGVARSRPQALTWMRQAAVLGDRQAQVLAAALSNPGAPPFHNERQIADYISRNYAAQTVEPGGGQATAPSVRRQPQGAATAADRREAAAVAKLMRSSMGFGGIFGSMIPSGLKY